MSRSEYTAEVYGPPGHPNLKGESGTGATGDDRVALALCKPADFVLFRNGERLSPAATIAARRAAPPDFPDPAAPACDSCWSQGLYVMLHQETSIYRL